MQARMQEERTANEYSSFLHDKYHHKVVLLSVYLARTKADSSSFPETLWLLSPLTLNPGHLFWLLLHAQPLDFWLSTLKTTFSVRLHCTLKQHWWKGFKLALGQNFYWEPTYDPLPLEWSTVMPQTLRLLHLSTLFFQLQWTHLQCCEWFHLSPSYQAWV